MLRAIKSSRSLLRALLLCALALASASCRAENLKVTVLLSESSAPYLSFANVLGKSLPATIRATVLDAGQLSPDMPQADLIVAAGMKAAELAVSKSGASVLTVMVPRMEYEDLLGQASSKKSAAAISGIYLDQPWMRQLDFLDAALPGKRRIGLLYSADSRIDIAPLLKIAAHRRKSLITQSIASSEELFPSLETVLNGSDVMLAIPDRMIYSSSNIRNILLTSFRHNVPLIGLSQAYVNAGAVSAIFSTPEQLAGQTGALVVAFARGRRLPEPQYPDDFTVAVNQQVARSLGIELPSAEAIRDRMNDAMEKRP